jgi:hypothetical protein
MRGLSFICLISYDWKYSFESILSYYDIADEIVLGIDRNRNTWAGNKYVLPEEFFDTIKNLDKDNKIKYLEEDFCTELNPMDNDIRERTILANKCIAGNWVVQIDADEIVEDAEALRLGILNAPEDSQVRIKWKTVFKEIPEGKLIIYPYEETTTIASLERNRFKSARVTDQRGHLIDGYLFHNSWGRTELELYQKLTNWGHAFDFPTAKYLEFWKSVNISNYQSIKNFHPLDGHSWKELIFEPRK